MVGLFSSATYVSVNPLQRSPFVSGTHQPDKELRTDFLWFHLVMHNRFVLSSMCVVERSIFGNKVTLGDTLKVLKPKLSHELSGRKSPITVITF